MAGNVGIGTYGATLNNKLNVGGSLSVGSTYTNNNTSAPTDGLSVSGALVVGTTNAATVNKADISGNVGIGTTYAGLVNSPTDGLAVAGNVGIGTYGASLANALNVAGAMALGSYATNNTAAPNANSMILSGTLGVGTSTSTNKIDVAGNASIGSGYAGVALSPNNGLTVQGGVGIGVSGTSLINKLNVSGNIGIGTTYAGLVNSPTDGLAVAGNVGIGTYGASLANALNVAGSFALGSYASTNTAAPTNGLIVSGNVGIGTNLPNYTLDVTPYGNGIINTPTIQLAKVLTTPGSNSINMSYSTLSNINVINSVNINTSGTVTSGGRVNIGTITPSYATSQSSASLIVTGGVAISQNILVSDTTDSTSSTSGAAIIYGGVGIAKSLNVGTTINAGTSVSTPSVITPNISSATNSVSFNYNRVLDVDSLVVRSNITVMMSGTATYTNLPTNLVSVDSATGKILDQYIGSNIVRLMNDGTINPALLPIVPSNRSTLLRTSDKVGIGLRNPQQKLHVFGNECITGGYLGIGTATPTAPLHIWDQNGTGGTPIVLIQETGSVDLIGVYGSNTPTPIVYVNGTCNVGINTTPAVNSIFSLDVAGKFRANTSVRTSALESDSGTINCTNTNFTNMQNVSINYLTVNGSVSLPTTNITSTNTTSIAVDTISALNAPHISMSTGVLITGFDNTLYASSNYNYVAGALGTPNIGLRVNESIMAKTILTISDERVKTNIISANPMDDLITIANIPVHKFNFIDRIPQPQILGFIAQEIEQYAPYAVSTCSGPIPNIMKYATLEENNSSVVILENHGLNINDMVKLLIDDVERIVTVIDTTPDTFTVDNPIPTGTSIYVYGIIVDDFKVIENERLIPLIFNGVKLLNTTSIQQQRTIQDLLNRVTTIESKLGLVGVNAPAPPVPTPPAPTP